MTIPINERAAAQHVSCAAALSFIHIAAWLQREIARHIHNQIHRRLRQDLEVPSVCESAATAAHGLFFKVSQAARCSDETLHSSSNS
jgi:hypothetical protein